MVDLVDLGDERRVLRLARQVDGYPRPICVDTQV